MIVTVKVHRVFNVSVSETLPVSFVVGVRGQGPRRCRRLGSKLSLLTSPLRHRQTQWHGFYRQRVELNVCLFTRSRGVSPPTQKKNQRAKKISLHRCSSVTCFNENIQYLPPVKATACCCSTAFSVFMLKQHNVHALSCWLASNILQYWTHNTFEFLVCSNLVLI